MLEAMRSLGKRCGFAIEDETYELYDSVLVTGIGGVENNQDDRGYYWVYWLDGDYATKSADHEMIDDGMFIEWKFEKY